MPFSGNYKFITSICINGRGRRNARINEEIKIIRRKSDYQYIRLI